MGAFTVVLIVLAFDAVWCWRCDRAAKPACALLYRDGGTPWSPVNGYSKNIP
jgi:hypothetical protein